MKVDVSALKDEPGARLGVEFQEDVGPLGEAVPLGPAQVRAELANTGSTIAVSGTAGVPVRLRCSRCLESYETRLEAELEDQYREVPGPPGEQEIARAVEEEGVILYHGREVDLGAPVRESLALAVPMQPLCDPACRGLCPACGADRNRQSCECESEAGGSRLAVLRQLVKDERPEGPKER